MVKAIFVCGTSKTSFIIGLGLKLKQEGYNVGYFKPFGEVTEIGDKALQHLDSDVIAIKELFALEDALHDISPVTYSDLHLKKLIKRGKNEILKEIDGAFAKIKENRDIVLVEGHNSAATGFFLDLQAPVLAKRFNADVILVAKHSDTFLEDLLVSTVFFKKEVQKISTVLNGVPKKYIEESKNALGFLLEKEGLNSLGIIPYEEELTIPTVNEIHEILESKIVAGEKHLDKQVRHIMVGAMSSDAAIKHFRKYVDKAVITGGDRGDVCLAAMETSVSCLILTGNLMPSPRVISDARNKGVPILMVGSDTFTTAKKLDTHVWRVKPGDKQKLNYITGIFNKHVNWKAIIQ
ncbi:MAG: phosphotransacetylase family protein [Candidatus Hodarchaeales archaeon]